MEKPKPGYHWRIHQGTQEDWDEDWDEDQFDIYTLPFNIHESFKEFLSHVKSKIPYWDGFFHYHNENNQCIRIENEEQYRAFLDLQDLSDPGKGFIIYTGDYCNYSSLKE